MATADLIARLESAAEGSRELDEGVARAIGTTNIVGDQIIDNFGFGKPVPAYTTSTDAAMTLIDQRWSFCMERAGMSDDWDCDVEIYAHEGELYEACAKGVPLAICAATLRARAASDGEGG